MNCNRNLRPKWKETKNKKIALLDIDRMDSLHPTVRGPQRILKTEEIKKETEEWLDLSEHKLNGPPIGGNSVHAECGPLHSSKEKPGVPAIYFDLVKPEANELERVKYEEHSETTVKQETNGREEVKFEQNCETTIKAEVDETQKSELGVQYVAYPEDNLTQQNSSSEFSHTKLEAQELKEHTVGKRWSSRQRNISYNGKKSLKTCDTKSHKGGKRHSCNGCEMRFRTLARLKEHQRIHTGEKPYHCTECGKRFCLLNTLKNHRVVHTGEKPYSCMECGRSFGRCSRLKSHQRIHTQEKPHSCTLCGKAFRLPETLKRHQRIHSGEKPYSCSDCGRSFTHCHRLKSHQQTHVRKST